MCNKIIDHQETTNNHDKPSTMPCKENDTDEGHPFQRVQVSKKKVKYHRTSLWSEVMSVWSEFFQHGLNVPLEAADDKTQHNYKPLHEDDSQSRRTTSRSASVPMLRSVGTRTTTSKGLKIKHKSSSSSKRSQKRLEDGETFDMENQATMV